MRRIGVLLVMLPLLWLSGCGEKKHPQNREKTPAVKTGKALPTSTRAPVSPRLRFTIRDIDRRETTLDFSGERAVFHRIHQPLVLITLFADWCPPCRGMLPYLSRLQEKNSGELFVIGVLVHSGLHGKALRRFLHRYRTNFFVSDAPDDDALGAALARRYKLGENYALPVTLIFQNGSYVMHLSGAAPYEMLQTLIDQLKEKKKE